MSFITTKDRTQIYDNDWGTGQPSLSNATLKVYQRASPGMCTTPKDRVNAEPLAFIKG